MGIETLTRGAKRSYEQYHALEMNGIDKLLFKTPDIDTSAAFMVDKLLATPAGIRYRDVNNESAVRVYQPGSGTIYEVPRASEKTPIPEDLKDSAVSGLEPTASQATHLMKLMDGITKQHVGGYHMTKWKQALDVYFYSKFYAKGTGGVDLGLGIDYERAAANELTHDFSGTDTIAIAFKEMQDQLIAQGSDLNNMVVLAGTDWLNEFATDTGVIAYQTTNPVNELLLQDLAPKELSSTTGTRIVASYRSPDMLAPVMIVAFQPSTSYIAYPGASAAPWITATKAVMFSLNMETFNVTRGVVAFNDSGKSEKVAADIVFDTFTDNDPIVDYVRSQTRHIFVPANINHTVMSDGTFS